MNQNFWLLLGSISTTLAAFALLGMTFYYQKAREAFDDINRLGAKATIDLKIVLYKSGNNLLFFLLPIMLSLIMITTNGNAWVFMFLLIGFSFFNCRQLDKVNKHKKYSFLDYFSGSTVIIIVAAIYILKLHHQILKLTDYESWFEIMAVFSLVAGILLSIHTISYLEKQDISFEISKTIIERWENKIKLILFPLANGTLDKINGCGIQEDEKKDIITQVKDILQKIEDDIKENEKDLDNKESENISMSYSKIKDQLNNYENIKGAIIDCRKGLCRMKLIQEKDIWRYTNKSDGYKAS